MRNLNTGFRRAAAALLAAAALPLAPLAAQEAQPAADPPAQPAEQPALEAALPAPTPAPPEPAPEPATAPQAETPAPPVARTATPARRAPARAPVAARPAPRAVAPAAPVAAAPAPAAPAPAAEVAPAGDAAAIPVGEVETLPAPAEAGTDVVPTTAAPTQQKDASILPWLIGGLLLAGALAYLLLRRRRRADDYVEDERVYDEPAAAAVQAPSPEPVVAPEPVRAPQPVATAPTIAAKSPAAPVGGSILTAPVVGTGFAAAAATRPTAVEMPVETAPAAAAPQGVPEIDLSMRAIRAGVQEDGARVEFELTVGNSGPVSAEDVRVSTWMLASGASEPERALIAPADHADTPPVTIPAGETRTLQAAVGLTSAEVTGDAVLPVVVADATYRLPDGSTGHATARFAVGVPDGEELAHFSIDNPSGLHEGVVARELG